MFNKYLISEDLLDRIIDEIEHYEVQIDAEWGRCRSIEQIIKDDDMPEIYKELIDIKTKQ